MKLVTRHTIPWNLRCESDTERDDPISRYDASDLFKKNWKEMKGNN